MFTPSVMLAMIWMTPNSLYLVPIPCAVCILSFSIQCKHFMGLKDSRPSCSLWVWCLVSWLLFRLPQQRDMSWPSLQRPPAAAKHWIWSFMCACVFLLLNVRLQWKALKCSGCALYLCSVLSPVCWWHPGVDLCDGSSTRCCPHTRSSRCGQNAWFEKKTKKKTPATLWQYQQITAVWASSTILESHHPFSLLFLSFFFS